MLAYMYLGTQGKDTCQDIVKALGRTGNPVQKEVREGSGGDPGEPREGPGQQVALGWASSAALPRGGAAPGRGGGASGDVLGFILIRNVREGIPGRAPRNRERS